MRHGLLVAALPAITGKLELVYEGEREGPRTVALKVVGQAARSVFLARCVSSLQPRDEQSEENAMTPVVSWFGQGNAVDLSDDASDDELYARLSPLPSLEDLASAHLIDPASGSPSNAELAAAMEFVLEGLHQEGLVAKEDQVGGKSYRDTFEEMVRSFHS